MDFKTFLHQHYLIFDEYENPEACCHRCNQQIHGLAYYCETCNFWLHDSCARQELPGQISHPLHPQHNLKTFLQYYDTHYICSKCFNLCRGHRYRCQDCHFDLDLSCAFTSDRNKPNDIKSKEIWHFSFDKPLVLFNYRRVAKYDYSCTWCERHALGICYGNLESLSNNIVLFSFRSLVGSAYRCRECLWLLDESCLESLKEMQHPFHPLHPLRPKIHLFKCCSACRNVITRIGYSCEQCQIHLDLDCVRAMKLPPLNFKNHSHDLFYFGPDNRKSSYTCRCDKCRKPCWGVPFYFCLKCKIYLHLECLAIPTSVKSGCHVHGLVLKDHFFEDNSGEYYCDVCEKERNPKNHVYSCEECCGLFVAHIECVLPMMEGTECAEFGIIQS